MKYRKKPVVIEAQKLTKENKLELMKWCKGKDYQPDPYDVDGDKNFSTRGLYIPTLEGDMYANIDDYIIQGIKGEFYPCKPDIFEATYEPVENIITINQQQ